MRAAGTPSPPPGTTRACGRPGCANPVHKRTARYCSVRCSSLDPGRRARLRAGAQRGRVVPLARQLTLNFDGAEAPLAQFAGLREDLPAGLARLAV
ncbi:MAG TPA: hypothetical protein VMW47_12545 [Verrucomicrobiae bacterium]|nr:hypothetical protein [Verrucomicrobiae bacterium]